MLVMHETFEQRLAQLIVGSGMLAQAERHLLGSTAAKRVRPRFLLACGALLDVPPALLEDLACAVELIHTATLLHDDIVDGATERRKLPSVNKAFGVEVAVLAGDGLLGQALLLFADSPRPGEAVKVAAQTVSVMAEAVVLEIELHDDANATADEMLSIADGKTGALFALCGYLAGLAANDLAAAERLAHVGRLMGRVFQIKDDIDDLEEDTANGTPTLSRVVGSQAALTKADESYAELLALLEPYQDHAAYPALIEAIQRITRTELALDVL
jgi:octaprenyl-diphosphate synthase